jgi:flagellin
MSLFVNTNVASMNAQIAFTANEVKLNKTYEQLSTGYKINSAGDDAAGLGIAKRMTAQVDSYAEAENNANDATSMVQTADGGAEQISSILDRLRQLAVEGSNGTMSTEDSANLNTEFQSQLSEITQIANTTNFNGINVLAGASASVTFQVGINTTDGASSDTVALSFGGADLTGLGLNAGVSVSSQANSQAAIGLIDTAIDTLSTTRASFGAAEDQLASITSNIQSISTNTSAALSQFEDVDVASATSALAQDQVLTQAGETVLAQANQSPQLAEALIRGQ